MWDLLTLKGAPLKFKAFMVFLVMSAVAALLNACKMPTEEEVIIRTSKEARLVAVVDDCHLWAVDDPQGREFYFSRCPEGASDTFEEHKSGKHSTVTTQTLGGK